MTGSAFRTICHITRGSSVEASLRGSEVSKKQGSSCHVTAKVFEAFPDLIYDSEQSLLFGVRVVRNYAVFSERELMFMFAICRRPSVCRLSSVTFVHPTQPIEIFGNVSMPFGTLAIYDPSVKILRRSA